MATEEKHNDGDDLDWDTLKKASLFPGGFGDDRRRLWPILLGVPLDTATDNADVSDDASVHSDEHQIRLDTDRSFVLYPVDDERRDREELQDELHQLLVAVFRKRPKLSYFQGYHDIVTVLFLTLPPELQLSCAEKLSLHRLRDSMGMGLEPVLGLIRVMQNLLRLADPELSEVLERTSPLPFYALSNILTLFSHDIPTLALIQHVFDYLLCRPPIAVVYLATAVILARKDEVRRLDEEDEDGMIHSLLSSLPDVTDEGIANSSRHLYPKVESSLPPSYDIAPANQIAPDEIRPYASETAVDVDASEADAGAPKEDLISEVDTRSDASETDIEASTLGEGLISEVIQPKDEQAEEMNLSSDLPSVLTKEEYLDEEKLPAEREPEQRRPSITLASLLLRADSLFETYPPTHPALGLSRIMGPKSVVFTWFDAISDDDAEEIVQHPEEVVFPAQPEDDEDELAIRQDNEKDREKKRRRRKLVKRRRTTMIATAVIVLGVAMAVYGTRNGAVGGARLHGGGSGHREFRKFGGWMRNVVIEGAARWFDGPR